MFRTKRTYNEIADEQERQEQFEFSWFSQSCCTTRVALVMTSYRHEKWEGNTRERLYSQTEKNFERGMRVHERQAVCVFVKRVPETLTMTKKLNRSRDSSVEFGCDRLVHGHCHRPCTLTEFVVVTAQSFFSSVTVLSSALQFGSTVRQYSSAVQFASTVRQYNERRQRNRKSIAFLCWILDFCCWEREETVLTQKEDTHKEFIFSLDQRSHFLHSLFRSDTQTQKDHNKERAKTENLFKSQDLKEERRLEKSRKQYFFIFSASSSKGSGWLFFFEKDKESLDLRERP